MWMGLVFAVVVYEAATAHSNTWLSDDQFAKELVDHGWSDCNLPTWDGESFPEEPVLIPRGSPSMEAFVNQEWPQGPADVIAEHGDEVRQVRWPSGHNQFGGVYRLAKVQRYILEEMHLPEGGLLFDAALSNYSEARSKLVEPLASMPPMVSLGGTRTGLPFHTHDAAWQSTIYGKKLWFVLPPLSEEGQDWLPKSQAQAEQLLARIMLPVNGTDDLVSSGRIDWILSKHPPIRKFLRHCIVGPGETIIVPCHWHHATINIGDVLAVGAQGTSVPCQEDRFSIATKMRKQAEVLRKGGEYREARDLQQEACDSNPFYNSCLFETVVDDIRDKRLEEATANVRRMAARLQSWADRDLLPHIVAASVLFSYANLAASIKTKESHELSIKLLDRALKVDEIAPISNPRLRIFAALHLPGSQAIEEARERVRSAKWGVHVFEQHAFTRLDSATKADLQWLCARHGLDSTGKKNALYKRLLAWRKEAVEDGEINEEGASIWYDSERGKLVNIFEELRDMYKMVDGFEKMIRQAHTDL